MKWYSNSLIIGCFVLAVLTTASESSSANCLYEELPGNCSSTNNCTNEPVHFLNPKYNWSCTDRSNYTAHICEYANYLPEVELGVKVPGPNDEVYNRIPDNNMDASSNQQDASRARIGMKQLGQFKAAWCAANGDDQKWLEVKFDKPADIEKIEIKGHPVDSSKWIDLFNVGYTNSSEHLVWYNNMMNFSSIENGSCHYVFINQTEKVRIYSKRNADRTCLQLAIYGRLPDSLPSKVVTVDPTSKYENVDSALITNKMFLEGYMLWAVFVALLIFLVIFTLAFLFCWCCRRAKPLKSAMEKSKEVNPAYVPAWRRIDEQAEKSYIATLETQEVKIAFTDEYIPPGIQKEKQNPNDEQFYRHRIFSFSGCQQVNTADTSEEPSKTSQENGVADR